MLHAVHSCWERYTLQRLGSLKVQVYQQLARQESCTWTASWYTDVCHVLVVHTHSVKVYTDFLHGCQTNNYDLIMMLE